MKEFTFRVTQEAIGYYEGNITISAKNEESARKKLNKMSQKELNDLAENWELGDDINANGSIEIHSLR